ncbi:MAG TPA: phage tail tube protein [Micromonosporaceae bacterium]|nr:phage tail tube protein [Micromonosporaceae bacterium]
MAGALDHQVGWIPEVTYGTPLTVTRFGEWDLGNSEHDWDPKPVQGTGMQVGDGGFARADRSVAVVGQGSGKIGLDIVPKGLGNLLNGPFGTGVTTLVGGTTWQQLFTTNLTGSLLPAYTLQYGVVRSDSGGTVDAYTYSGVTFPKLTLSCETGDVLKGEWEWDARSQTKVTALATAAYTNTFTPFHFGQAAATFGGALVVPTTTVMGSGGTAATNIKSFSLELDNQADTDRWVFGGTRNQPRVAKRVATITMEAEYDAATYDDAMVGHTTVGVSLTFTTTDALSTGFTQFQIMAPACKVTAGGRPSPTDETPTTELELEVKKPSSGAALYVAVRTSDATNL